MSVRPAEIENQEQQQEGVCKGQCGMHVVMGVGQGLKAGFWPLPKSILWRILHTNLAYTEPCSLQLNFDIHWWCKNNQNLAWLSAVCCVE